MHTALLNRAHNRTQCSWVICEGTERQPTRTKIAGMAGWSRLLLPWSKLACFFPHNISDVPGSNSSSSERHVERHDHCEISSYVAMATAQSRLSPALPRENGQSWFSCGIWRGAWLLTVDVIPSQVPAAAATGEYKSTVGSLSPGTTKHLPTIRIQPVHPVTCISKLRRPSQWLLFTVRPSFVGSWKTRPSVGNVSGHAIEKNFSAPTSQCYISANVSSPQTSRLSSPRPLRSAQPSTMPSRSPS